MSMRKRCAKCWQSNRTNNVLQRDTLETSNATRQQTSDMLCATKSLTYESKLPGSVTALRTASAGGPSMAPGACSRCHSASSC